MEEKKSKLISFAVLFALFLSAVAFASRYDRSENHFFKKSVEVQSKTDTGAAKKTVGAETN